MERIKQAWLENGVRNLNIANGFGANPKYSTIGAYTLDGAYGGWQLQQYCNESGGVSVVSRGGYVSKRELYDQICAIMEYEASKRKN